LTSDEGESLLEMIQSTNRNGNLLYRGSRDGFTALAFHEKCDGKSNTVTIIKTDEDYVFGGYTSAAWHSKGNFIKDANAFIFSLRKNGISDDKKKFKVKNENKAIYGNLKYGPAFGDSDIVILDGSNKKPTSFSTFCVAYECPQGYEFRKAKQFLAGSSKWLTTEIEVYRIHQ
jgi:hypothetical protein